LLIDALQLMDTPGFEPMQQDESQATIYPKKRRPEDSEIDPNKSLVELFDTIRACDPQDFPAFFFIEGQRVCIRLWRPERPVEEDDDTL
jgi:methionyl-tRNA formyltransferase